MELGIHFGALAESIYKQVKAQGFKIDKERAKYLQSLADATLSLYYEGIVTDKQKEAMQKRIFSRVKKSIITK